MRKILDMPLRDWRINLAFRSVVCLLAALALSSCYRADAITGTVLDEATGKPIAGAAVVANWQASGPNFDLRDSGRVETFETTSDSRGEFRIASWGPRWHWFGKIDKVTATLYVFKSGYEGVAIKGESDGNAGYVPNVNLTPRAGAVKLVPASTSQRERIGNFDLFNVQLRPLLYQGASCPWSRIPTMLRELHVETLRLLPNSRDSGAWPLMTLDQDLIMHADQLTKEAGLSCASPKEIFRLQSAP